MFGRISALSLAGLLAGFNSPTAAAVTDYSIVLLHGETTVPETSVFHHIHAPQGHDTLAARTAVFEHNPSLTLDSGPPSLAVEGLAGAGEAVSRYLSLPRQSYGGDIGSDGQLLALGVLGLLLVGAAILLRIKKAPD